MKFNAIDIGDRHRGPERCSSLSPGAFFTWTGCYVGGNVGGVWVNKEWFDDVPGFAETSLGTHTANGWLGGVQGGCNYQVGNWVFGLQGDYDWAMATGNNVNTLFPLLTDRSNVRSLSSVTGRAGYAWDRFLLYKGRRRLGAG